MRPNEHIGRLQELLERVQARAGSPRAEAGNGAAHAAPTPSYLEEEPMESAAPVTPTHAQFSPDEPRDDAPTLHPATAAPAYDDSDVEVSSEVVDIDIDIDEAEAIESGMESGAQPVAHATTPPQELEEVEEPPMAAYASELPQELEEVVEAAPANEIEELTPSSSRRPIAGEEPAAEAYEEESAPRHTPPPESGKQVAAAPSNLPPARSAAPEPLPRLSSAPPPSIEGHTLIGGWREPGLGAQQFSTGPSVGVRVPGPGPAPTSLGSEPPATVLQPHASVTRLSPDVTQPEFAVDVSVASFQGALPVAKPTTLGELLDLTLSL